MKLSAKDLVLIVISVVIVAAILLFGFPSPNTGTNATSTWTVDFADMPSPYAPGNATTWTFENGSWNTTTYRNGGHSVWLFCNMSSEANISISGSPLTVVIDFGRMASPWNPGNRTSWTYDQGTWSGAVLGNSGHSMWTLANVTSQSKCFRGDTVTTTFTIDFMGADSPTDPGNLTTWTRTSEGWSKTSVANDGHSVWVFANVTSKPTAFDQLKAAEKIGGFNDTNSPYGYIGGIEIQSLAGLANSNSGGPGWQYYVNGVYANRSCSLYYLSNGDNVVWMYKPLVS